MGLRDMLARLMGEKDTRPKPGGDVAVMAATQSPPNDAPDPSKNIDESALAEELFRADPTPGLMVDVGAHFGTTTKPFLAMGWRVIGFEPDPKKHAALKELAEDPNFTLLKCAVGDTPAENVPFFTSQESTGIASLVPFRDSHEKGPTVEIRTLRDVLAEHGVEHVDYLKIDAEGYDLRVLQGFPFDAMTPRMVVCEFEDAKTNQIGYTTHDLGQHLLDLGYEVYLSEWHPVVRYGITHRWRSLRPYPCELEDTNGWGNFVAVLPGETSDAFKRIAQPWL